LILLTVFELLPKTCNFTICSIFSNSGHVGWCTATPDTILKLDTLVMIQTKFGFYWSQSNSEIFISKKISCFQCKYQCQYPYFIVLWHITTFWVGSVTWKNSSRCSLTVLNYCMHPGCANCCLKVPPSGK
jgi:hypothetical protein